MGHTIEEIREELNRANNYLSDSQSAADGANCAAEEASSYAADAQSNAEEASTYADDAQTYISGVLDMLDEGLDAGANERDFIEPLSLLNEKLTAIAAVMSDALTHLNGILSDINQEHLPLDPNNCVVAHEFIDPSEEEEEKEVVA